MLPTWPHLAQNPQPYPSTNPPPSSPYPYPTLPTPRPVPIPSHPWDGERTGEGCCRGMGGGCTQGETISGASERLIAICFYSPPSLGEMHMLPTTVISICVSLHMNFHRWPKHAIRWIAHRECSYKWKQTIVLRHWNYLKNQMNAKKNLFYMKPDWESNEISFSANSYVEMNLLRIEWQV